MKLAVVQHEKIKSQYYINIEGDLPELTGSPKQIKWAEDIRSEYLGKYQKEVAFKLSNEVRGKGDVKGCAPVLEAVSNVTNAHNEAKWWIENRNNLTSVTGTEYRTIINKEKEIYTMTVKVIVRKPWDDGFRTYAKGDVVSVIDGEKITGISTEGRHIKISFTNGLSEFYKRAYVDIVINNMEGDRGEEI